MRKIILYLLLGGWAIAAHGQEKMQAINPILQDQSYFCIFGELPDASTDDQLRIQAHLAFVEELLRNTVRELNPQQQQNRDRVLDKLHEYWQAGRFPVNRDYPGERRPCFIDDEGTICAVGYLIEQTKGRAVAEDINKDHQYDFLLDMNEPAIEAWADEYGLTLLECAMIQPAYPWLPPPIQTKHEEIKPGYGISSGIAGGANIAVNILNFSNRWKYSPTVSYIGLAAGTGQIILGVANMKKSKEIEGSTTYVSYKAQNNLSYANIALGTTTILTSTFNLVMQKKNREKDKRNSFNLYSYPNYTNSLSMGLSFTRRI